MAIRGILFDIGDTLFRLDPLPEDVRAGLVDVLRDVCPEAVAAEYSDEIQDTIRDAMEQAYRPGLTAELDCVGTIADVIEALDGADVPRLSRRLADVFGKADVGRFDADEELGDRVATFLDRGMRLGVVSNTSTRAALLTAFLDRLGLNRSLFRTMVFSVDIGVRKPNPKIYARAIAQLGTRPDETLFVGDRVREDVRGPMLAGMHAVLTHEFRQEETGTARPVAVIKELMDVHEVLRRLGV